MSPSSIPPLELMLKVAGIGLPEASRAVPTGANASSSAVSGWSAMICGESDLPFPSVPPAKLFLVEPFVASASGLSSCPGFRPCLPPIFALPPARPPRWSDGLLPLAAFGFRPDFPLPCPRRLPGALTITLRVPALLPRLVWSLRTSVSSIDTSRSRPSGVQMITSSYGLSGSKFGFLNAMPFLIAMFAQISYCFAAFCIPVQNEREGWSRGRQEAIAIWRVQHVYGMLPRACAPSRSATNRDRTPAALSAPCSSRSCRGSRSRPCW
eukprot:7387916-Prymnesium_polylepis.2